MTDWHILAGLMIDVHNRLSPSVSDSQNSECCSKYSAIGLLQKFAADLILFTTQNSQPCKIVTLSLNSNQNLHTPAPQISALQAKDFKNSFVIFNQEIVMQLFGLYNRYSILITVSRPIKFLFHEFRFHPSSPSSPFPSLSRLKTLEPPTELPAHFVFFAFEVLGPDTLDNAICCYQ